MLFFWLRKEREKPHSKQYVLLMGQKFFAILRLKNQKVVEFLISNLCFFKECHQKSGHDEIFFNWNNCEQESSDELHFGTKNEKWQKINSPVTEKMKVIHSVLQNGALITVHFQCSLFLRITTLLSWLKSSLLLKITCFDSTIYMKTQYLQTNETQHY